MSSTATPEVVPAPPASEPFVHWAIVEIFGHVRIAGQVREQLIAGKAFLRVDVPAVDGAGAFTRYYGASAIYSLTPTTEDIARVVAAQLRVAPVAMYVPSARQLLSGSDGDDFEFEDLQS